MNKVIALCVVACLTGCSRFKPAPTDAEVLASVGIATPKPDDSLQVKRKVRVLPVAGSDFQRR